ncbi:glycosyltransferase [Leucobacter sp. USCH14]|uniref:glycosyltransferase n=1 Tax=Leucobacter sp. USCH14 TaxID=3024838 RepID=UPI00309FE8AE
MTVKPNMLILSFSRIESDARILKQIRLFADDFAITTCGYGARPEGTVAHVEVDSAEPRLVVLLRAAFIRLHLFALAYRITPAVRQAKRGLRKRDFDVVLANDLDTVGVALSVAPQNRVHVDLHEYWPGREDQNPAWVKVRLPYYLWQLRRKATRARSVTTVSSTIAARYAEEFDIEAGVVTNASPARDFSPTEVAEPLRVVHSGASLASRRVENIMRGVAQARNGATLDLFLVGEGTPYHDGLRALAKELGPRITVLPPVPQEDLLDTLNRYDVGIHVLPPTNTNNALALPNKFFDYVQARLALLIGPTASMVDLLQEHELGVVTDGFTPAEISAAVEDLDLDKVRIFKANAEAAAERLSSEYQNVGWADAIYAITSTGKN